MRGTVFAGLGLGVVLALAVTGCSSGSSSSASMSKMQALADGTAPPKYQAMWEAQMACTSFALGFSTPKPSIGPGGRTSAEIVIERARKAAALDPATYTLLVDQITALGTTAAARDAPGFTAAFETVSANCTEIEKLVPYKY